MEEIKLLIASDLLKIEEAVELLGSGGISARGFARLDILREIQQSANDCKTWRNFCKKVHKLYLEIMDSGTYDEQMFFVYYADKIGIRL